MQHKVRSIITAIAAFASMLSSSSAFAADFKSDIPRPQRTNTETSARAATQLNTAALERKVIRIKADNVPASAVFLAIAEKAGMRVGVELTRPSGKAKLVSLDIKGRTVFEALDQLYFADQSYLLTFGGSGYENLIPREYKTRDVREVGDTSPPYVPAPYIFTANIDTIEFAGKSPEQAVRDLLSRSDVRSQPPSLPVEVVSSCNAPSGSQLRFGTRNVDVRSLMNTIAGTTGKSWIAYIDQDPQGKKTVKVQMFEAASEVCPEAGRVAVELEVAQPINHASDESTTTDQAKAADFTVRYFILVATPPAGRKGDTKAMLRDLDQVGNGIPGPLDAEPSNSVAALKTWLPAYEIQTVGHGSRLIKIGNEYPADKDQSVKISANGNTGISFSLEDEFAGSLTTTGKTVLRSRGTLRFCMPGRGMEPMSFAWDGSYPGFQLGRTYCVGGALLPDGRILLYEFCALPVSVDVALPLVAKAKSVWSGISAVADAPSVQGSWGPSLDGFQMQATPVQTFGSAEPSKLRLICRNVADKPLALWFANPAAVYDLSVQDSSGTDVPMRPNHGIHVTGSVMIALAPGGKSVSEYPVSKMYDLSTPGEYRITARRPVLRLDGEGYSELVSSIVVLSVPGAVESIQASRSSSANVPQTAHTAKATNVDASPRMVAIRPILERHGCRLAWDSKSRKAAVFTADGRHATIRVESNVMAIAGQAVKMWSPAKLVNWQLVAPGDAVSQITAPAVQRGTYKNP